MHHLEQLVTYFRKNKEYHLTEKNISYWVVDASIEEETVLLSVMVEKRTEVTRYYPVEDLVLRHLQKVAALYFSTINPLQVILVSRSTKALPGRDVPMRFNLFRRKSS